MKNIKKPIGIIIAFTLLLLSLSGCTVKEENNDNNKETSGINNETTTNNEVTTGENTGEHDTTVDQFNYSAGILESGYWMDIKALDFVTLAEYDKISIPKEIHEVPDTAIQTEVESILSLFATENQVNDRAVKDGDTVNIDYTGSVDGVEFEGGSTNGLGTDVTIGVTQYIDDFLEQLIGHKPGESFDITVTFPEDYGKDELNGKDAVFAVTINYISEVMYPEATDEFVKENLSNAYDWNTVEQMNQGVRDELRKNAISHYVQGYMLENSTVSSIPEDLMEYQENSLIYYFLDYANNYDMELNEFLEAYAEIGSVDELLEIYYEDNLEMATFYLVIQAVAEEADITVNDDDVAQYFINYQGADDYTQYEEYYGMPYLKLLTLNQAVIDRLAENAVVE